MGRKFVGVVGVVATAAFIGVTAEKRWSVGRDNVDGNPLGLPNGESKILETPEGAELALTIFEGNSDPILLSHGWTESQALWSTVVLKLLKEGKTVITYDHQGHGESTVGNAKLDVDLLAKDMALIIETLDLKNVVLGGHSMGGMTVQAFMVNHKDIAKRVKGIALIATTSRAALGSKRLYVGASKLVASPLLERALENNRFGAWFARLSVGKHAHLSHLLAVRDMFLISDRKARGELAYTMASLNLTSRLRELEVPSIVMVGTRDTLTPLYCAREIASNLVSARLEVLKDLGHMLPFEAPDRVVDALKELDKIEVVEK